MQSPAARDKYAFISTLEIPCSCNHHIWPLLPQSHVLPLFACEDFFPHPQCQLLHHGPVSKSPDGEAHALPPRGRRELEIPMAIRYTPSFS